MSDFTRFSGEVMTSYALVESKILDTDLWRVMKGFRYYVGDKGSNKWVDVPRGYLVDGASVPRILWSIIPPWGRYGAATIVHDILCEYLSLTLDGRPCKITREQADNVLFEAMLILDVDAEQYRRIHAGVATYRRITGINKPVWSDRKAQLEAAWVAANPET
jgi:hypothetical protein